jgi:hypothetical protein
MKTSRTLGLALLATLILTLPAMAHRRQCEDSLEMDFDGTTLVIEHDGWDDDDWDRDGWNRRDCGPDVEVEVTRDLDLYIDGERIPLDREERELLGEYYEIARDIVAQAKAIEMRSDEIEYDAERLERRVEAGVYVMLASIFSDLGDRHGRHDRHLRDHDDWEDDLEELTEWAEELGREGERIGRQVGEMRDIMDELQDRVPELDELDWR